MSEALGGGPLWRWSELVRVMNALRGAPATGPDLHGVAIDSRRVRSGDLFVALTGAVPPPFHGESSGRDGHDFVADAAARGAAGALVAHPCQAGIPELHVADTFDGLWRLGRAGRERAGARIFAVTGSSGKTTAKGMLGAALGGFAAGVHSAEGSFNNHLGVPLSLARLPATASAGVFELGMNHPGEIAPLARLVRPHVALVLNVLPVHLAGVGDLEAVRREKLSLAAGLAAGGTLVVPEDLAVHDVPRGVRRLTFGTEAAADVRLERDADAPRAEPTARIRLPDGRRLALEIPGGGVHRALTATAVLACVIADGRDPQAAAERLAATELPRGRGDRIEIAGVTLIDESYNANPVSTRHALDALASARAGRRLALLGDMLELGEAERAYHRELAQACRGLDGVWCIGERMQALYDALPARLRAGRAESCETLDLDALAAALAPGDLLLIKGSNRLFWKHGTVAGLCERLRRRVAPE